MVEVTRERYAAWGCLQKDQDHPDRNTGRLRQPSWVAHRRCTTSPAARLLAGWVRRQNSARGAQDLDSEDQRVALLDPGLGLTVGVTILRGHRDTDGRPDLLPGDRLLKTRHDSVEREVNRGAAFVSAVEHTAVTSVDAHVADGN